MSALSMIGQSAHNIRPSDPLADRQVSYVGLFGAAPSPPHDAGGANRTIRI
jgi:hypothetical protein